VGSEGSRAAVAVARSVVRHPKLFVRLPRVGRLQNRRQRHGAAARVAEIETSHELGDRRDRAQNLDSSLGFGPVSPAGGPFGASLVAAQSVPRIKFGAAGKRQTYNNLLRSGERSQ